MTTESAMEATVPDVHALLTSYRSVVIPAAGAFVREEISANELKRQWSPYYYRSFREYDLAVERAWRRSTGTDGSLEGGTPQSDPRHAVPLSHFPVSTAHNNLDRLVEVLAIELGDRTVAEIAAQERKVDFAHMVDELDTLMSSLTA
jgi:hypothetical protein